jgi:biopolymer transport protein TolR
MAFSGLGSNGGSRRGRWRASGGSLAEMNVVPLVDVVLVLLIIFMITASTMEFGLEIAVPEVKQPRDTAEELPVVSITRDGKLYLGDQGVNINKVGAEVKRRFPDSKKVYLVGDKNSQVGEFVQVIGALSDAKLAVSVVAKQQDVKKP